MGKVQSVFILALTLCPQFILGDESIKVGVVHFPDDVTNSKGMINNNLLKNEVGIVDWNLASPSRYVVKAEVVEANGQYSVRLTTTREPIVFNLGTDVTFAINLTRVFNEEQVLRLIYRGDWNRKFQQSIGAHYFNKKQNMLDYYVIDLSSAEIELEDGTEGIVPALNGKKLSSEFVRSNINSRF